jgi:hypothetical protein
LSPVNYDPEGTQAKVLPAVEQRQLDLVFDPQLYNPRSDNAKLTAWRYFPRDFDTSDTGDLDRWSEINRGLAEAGLEVFADKICSPSTLPRAFDDAYYGFSNSIYRQLAERLTGTEAEAYQTVIVNLSDIGRANRAEQIASITLQANPQGIYLVIATDVRPRLELADAESLRGLMLLIHYLEAAEVPVIVANSSSDHVLWKAAGATACATGKFFNLRRFTFSRFEDPTEGGRGALAYWFEEGSLAFLREGDLARLRRSAPSMVGVGNSTNSFGDTILRQTETSPGTAWVAHG